ncbi:hypothetical protein BP6252_02034 [Coleophoma cylindrospora]|uniref:N-acetyltransferase domain-containing protein n=1 Tax=Coleophoma cylindrospora TaxID=1849047 RepID=A0A3D8SEC1_9HELO|nr:hypothetical protein BP6252_02034 [Coleophoma cylindrospora]
MKQPAIRDDAATKYSAVPFDFCKFPPRHPFSRTAARLAIQLVPAESADSLELAVVEAAVTFSEPVSQIMWIAPSEERHKKRAKQYAKDMETSPTSYIVKAVLDGKVVGFAQWHFFDKQPKPMEEWKDMEAWDVANSLECANYMLGISSRMRNKYVNGTQYAFLQILVVLPEWQRQGVGSLLLQEGLAKADQAGLPTWLLSSPEGYGLYQKAGFEDRETLEIDLSRFGGEGTAKRIGMLKPYKVVV